jgi:hypothetical protein
MRALFVAMACVGVSLAAVGYWPKEPMKTVAHQNTCTSNLRQLAGALENYRDTFGRYPPAYKADASGKPLYSWRVSLLPFLGEDNAYFQLDRSQPWNSPHNKKIVDSIEPWFFHCPSAKGERYETSYVAVVGPETAWPGAKAMRLGDIGDRPGQTILLIEVVDSGIHWAEPRDWPYEWAIQGINTQPTMPGLSSGHRSGAQAAFFDGTVRFLPNDTPLETLRALLTANGGEEVTIPE